jgi:hypothetical protein
MSKLLTTCEPEWLIWSTDSSTTAVGFRVGRLSLWDVYAALLEATVFGVFFRVRRGNLCKVGVCLCIYIYIYICVCICVYICIYIHSL